MALNYVSIQGSIIMGVDWGLLLFSWHCPPITAVADVEIWKGGSVVNVVNRGAKR